MSSFENLDLYAELEIPKEATQEEIKKAYKKLVMKWHPDKNSNDPTSHDKFQKIAHAYSILSDPNKRAYYDKYGKLDEDNFNFEEFMKNFKFDVFYDFDDKLFGNKGFFDPAAVESRHSLKLMYIRKKAMNKPFKKENVEDKTDDLPLFIFGPGKGLKSTELLEFQNKKQEEDEADWTTDDEDNDKEEEDVEELESDEDTLEIFIQENSKQLSKNKFVCLYCAKDTPDQSFTPKQLKEHFIDSHRKQFEEFFGNDVNWDEIINATKNKKGKKKGKKFNMGGMPIDVNMISQMFGMPPEEAEHMLEDFGKMFGGAGGDIPGMGGFPGGMPFMFPGFPGGMGGFPGGMGGFPGGMGGFPGGMGGFPGGMGGFPGDFPDFGQGQQKQNKKKK